MERNCAMSIIRVVTILCLLIGGVDGFSVSKCIFSRRASASPKVEHIPLLPSTRIPSIRSIKASVGDAESHKRGGFRNRVTSLRENIRGPWRKSDGKVGRRAMLVSVASALVALLARPTRALAMGAMGGTKGPVAPLQRYVRSAVS
jgi:hypothetical protein